jgi:hypothetical protein
VQLQNLQVTSFFGVRQQETELPVIIDILGFNKVSSRCPKGLIDMIVPVLVVIDMIVPVLVVIDMIVPVLVVIDMFVRKCVRAHVTNVHYAHEL